ncbi:uncharacterized protein LOC142575824 isoform X3 [Dermacentor variabilis]|uniref:uncharacterized protein LOC142575824 isoform X3 n=1 Tax=Dermacentor variabilis TaxID=34621 RepID=UPI003F5C1CC4
MLALSSIYGWSPAGRALLGALACRPLQIPYTKVKKWQSGCSEILSLHCMAAYEKFCTFRQLRCLFNCCGWVHCLNKVAGHLAQQHNVNVIAMQVGTERIFPLIKSRRRRRSKEPESGAASHPTQPPARPSVESAGEAAGLGPTAGSRQHARSSNGGERKQQRRHPYGTIHQVPQLAFRMHGNSQDGLHDNP